MPLPPLAVCRTASGHELTVLYHLRTANVTKIPDPERKKGQAPPRRGMRPGPASPERWLLLHRKFPAERDHARDLPLLPHLVHPLLEVPEVLFREVGEAALLEQVLPHGLARLALNDGLGLAVVAHHVVFDLVEREDASLDGELAQLVGEHGVVIPALRTRVERVDEGRP